MNANLELDGDGAMHELGNCQKNHQEYYFSGVERMQTSLNLILCKISSFISPITSLEMIL